MKRIWIGILLTWMIGMPMQALPAQQLHARESVIMTQELRDSMSPAQILERFKAGNRRFVLGKFKQRNYLTERNLTASSQHPNAIVLSCIDSRMPVEIIFDKSIGDTFNAKIAGNIVNVDILGSMEYATKVSGAKLIVIMGHTNCGAIKSAIDDVHLGNINALLNHIKPAVESTTHFKDRTVKNKKFVAAVAKRNILLVEKQILRGSPIIRKLVAQGKVKIVGCMYNLETGVVDFYE